MGVNSMWNAQASSSGKTFAQKAEGSESMPERYWREEGSRKWEQQGQRPSMGWGRAGRPKGLSTLCVSGGEGEATGIWVGGQI